MKACRRLHRFHSPSLNVMSAKVIGLPRSPSHAFPGFTGQTPSAFTPTGILLRSSVSRMQPLMIIPLQEGMILCMSSLSLLFQGFYVHNRPESHIASPHGASRPSHCCVALPQDNHRAHGSAYSLKHEMRCRDMRR